MPLVATLCCLCLSRAIRRHAVPCHAPAAAALAAVRGMSHRCRRRCRRGGTGGRCSGRSGRGALERPLEESKVGLQRRLALLPLCQQRCHLCLQLLPLRGCRRQRSLQLLPL